MANDRHSLLALAAYLAQRRPAVLAAWHQRVVADPKLTTGNALPRAQLQDHLPALLEDFERRLGAADARSRAAAENEQKGDAAAHGLHRWQQGFDLGEVTRELGRLNQCVVAELERYATEQPHTPAESLAEARAIWAELYSVAASSSASQYFRLQQIEAAGHVADLEHALGSLRELEQQRAVLWQQAAHDLRGNLGVVVMATAGLQSAKASEDLRTRFLGSLDRNVRALHRLLEDVTSLARLHGGQEVRSLATMDASRLLGDLAEALQAFADDRSLDLVLEGPPEFEVVGDAIKIRRIVQNLVFNAIKYTRQGSVAVRWGEAGGVDTGRWFVQVEDTGPGFAAGPRAALAGAIGVATDIAKDMKDAAASGTVKHTERADTSLKDTEPPAALQPGEGIGLSIVKRLCALLDATLEFDSDPGRGTTFRVLLPKRYDA